MRDPIPLFVFFIVLITLVWIQAIWANSKGEKRFSQERLSIIGLIAVICMVMSILIQILGS